MADAPPPPPQKSDFDPDDYRMSVGEHLEELRRRVILGLVGFTLVLVVCLIFGDRVFGMFCRPLEVELARLDLNPQVHIDELGEAFLVWLRVNIVTAIAIASPWIVFQLWQFVAAGLYSHERKYITRYAPMSIALLIGGMLFVYFLVLPWTIRFFVDFANSIPMSHTQAKTDLVHEPLIIPVLPGDPVKPADRALWIDSTTGQIKIFFGGQVRAIRFSSQNLVATDPKLSQYIDLVVGMLLTFGLSFQLPLVVMALVRIGVVEVAQLRSMRRYVYFGLAVLAAAITPGDVITATVMLMVPLALLYELGIWLARTGTPAQAE